MSSGTSIEWTDATWNPIRARVLREAGPGRAGWHCEKVSPGCANCYAERFNGRGLPNGGTRLSYTKGSRAQVETFVDEDVLREPLRWRKPRRVFVESMSDLFGEWVSDEQLDRVFAVMELAPRHTFQVLTKRPERMLQYFRSEEELWGSRWPRAVQLLVGEYGPTPFPLHNVWLGVSVEDQARADERIPLLLDTPAAMRFLSCEPLLGPVSIERALCSCPWPEDAMRSRHNLACRADTRRPDDPRRWAGIDWCIIGGESGPGARPCDVAWIRSIVEQCRAAGAACFVKQLGAKPITDHRTRPAGEDWTWTSLVRDRKGGAPSEWPEDLRVREFPREAVRS